MVPTLSMVFMVVVMLICIVVPFGAMLFTWSRRNTDGSRRFPRLWRAFWCGALAFTVSQVLTRLPLMTLVVPQLPEAVAGFLVSGPVASFTAGLFEETGRLVVMLLLLKAFHRWIDGVSFGLGHGGIEAILLIGLANVNNLVLAATINAGQWDVIAQALPPEAADQLFTALTQTAPAMFLLGGVERLAAITLHIACSLIVLAGIVHGRKLVAWVVAVLVHAGCSSWWRCRWPARASRWCGSRSSWSRSRSRCGWASCGRGGRSRPRSPTQKWRQPPGSVDQTSPSTVTDAPASGSDANTRPITVQPSGTTDAAGNVANSAWSSPPVRM